MRRKHIAPKDQPLTAAQHKRVFAEIRRYRLSRRLPGAQPSALGFWSIVVNAAGAGAKGDNGAGLILLGRVIKELHAFAHAHDVYERAQKGLPVRPIKGKRRAKLPASRTPGSRTLAKLSTKITDSLEWFAIGREDLAEDILKEARELLDRASDRRLFHSAPSYS